MFFWRKIGLLWRKDEIEETSTCASGTEIKPLTYEKLKKAIAILKALDPNPIVRVECSPAGYKELTAFLPAGPPVRNPLYCGPGVMLVEKVNQKEKYKIIRRIRT